MIETVAIRWWLAALVAVSALLLPHAFDDPFAPAMQQVTGRS